MDDVADAGNIETSRRNIRADENGRSTFRNSRFNVVHALFEAIKTLEPLLLLHLGVEAVVLDLEEVKETGETAGGRDGVAEDDDHARVSALQLAILGREIRRVLGEGDRRENCEAPLRGCAEEGGDPGGAVRIGGGRGGNM